MPKESQNFNAEPDGRNTDKALSGAEQHALRPEEISTHRMYLDMVKKGELDIEPKCDKDGKIIGLIIKEKDAADGKPGKTLYFEDENMLGALETYDKKFFPPENLGPREN